EQIDALEIMGVNTTAYLVGPKIAAALVMIPLLVIIAATTGIWGGLMAGKMSGLVSGQQYIEGAQMLFVAFNIKVMLIKAASFGFLLTSIACYQGYYAYGGALEIGKASTRAVVLSSISILVTDFLLAFMLL
ncbi:MAG TPA: ABC transporter permease, partial [Chitinophagaceae bacterium]|nr:ABC transporter permease [Chitinophagaceae bacterium]